MGGVEKHRGVGWREGREAAGLLILDVGGAEVLDDDLPAHFLKPRLDGLGLLADWGVPRGLRRAAELDLAVAGAEEVLEAILEHEHLPDKEEGRLAQRLVVSWKKFYLEKPPHR